MRVRFLNNPTGPLKKQRAETQKSCILIENYKTDVKNVTAPSAVKYKKKPVPETLTLYRGIQPLSHEESQNVTSCHSCHSHSVTGTLLGRDEPDDRMDDMMLWHAV